jgi:hypothetical protein
MNPSTDLCNKADVRHQSHRKTRQVGSAEEMIRIALAGLSEPR